MINGLHKQSGFTLVEVVVSISITAILLAALAGLFSSLAKSYAYGERRYDAQQTANLVLLNISSNLRYGNSYAIENFEQALNGKALYYKSIKPDDTGEFYYYINKDDYHFYRVAKNGGTPTLVPGHTFIRPTDIQIITIPEKAIFTVDNSQVNISIRVKDTVRQQNIDATITITPIDNFIK